MAGRRRLMFAKPPEPTNYLRFTALESGTFTLTIGNSVSASDLSYIEYSTDEGETWTKTDNSGALVTITTPTISTGNSVLWRGSGERMGTASSADTSANYSKFSSTCQCNISGKINTLLGLDSPNSVSACVYKYMFYGMTTLIDASGLIMPSSIGSYCCWHMFDGCSSMTAAPVELPATTLTSTCYHSMFYGCSSLLNAPYLPATTLASGAYSYMFQNCTSLIYIKADFQGVIVSNNISNYYWTSGVTTQGTFIKNPLLPSGGVNLGSLYNGDSVPYTWTVVTGFTVNSWTSGKLNTTPTMWIYLPTYSSKTLHLIIEDREYIGTVSYTSTTYTYSGTSQDSKTISIQMTASRDRSGNISSVSMAYTPDSVSDYMTGFYNCSYYGTDE